MHDPEGPVRIDDSIAYRLHRVARVQRRHFLRLAERHGLSLTPEQWFVLNKLRLQDGQSPSELVDAIFGDRPNLTRLLVGLERKGYVARRPDPDDGRRQRVHLTLAGADLHDRFAAIVPGTRAAVFAGIDADELAVAERVLRRLEENFLAHDG